MGSRAAQPAPGDRGDGVGSPLLNAVMHTGFLLLLLASAARLLIRHDLDGSTVAALELAAVVALLYAAGLLLWHRAPRPVLVGWLAAVVVCWTALVWIAPSFSFAAIPLLFLALRLLPVPAAVAVAAVLAAATTAAWAVLTDVRDPTVFVVPAALAAMVVGTVTALRREGDRRRRTIDDLLRTRGALAESHRRTGVLEERERLAREIHDTVAQGLSSTGMLLRAADLSWDTDPERARALVRQAARSVHDNLAEARTFVQGEPPAPLMRATLSEALEELCRDLSAETGIEAGLRHDGDPDGLPDPVGAALLRIAQGALANVREHSGATRVVVSLARIGDRATLDVRDDGVGFDPAAPGATLGRGFGLGAARARVEELGGSLAVESAPGEGTGISVSIPLEETA
ncbi:sensor histidine kinase [Nocardiopsis aegyptia]|uniref:sensor histidine kinase n=1 Tax=Nocardiopsis aegyptia TaxID=220378 RepID=UPI00366DA6E0